MEWIESHKSLARHPKTKRLARALDVSIPAAVGHLHLLWWWATDYAQDGYLTAYEAEDIADAAMWEGNAGEFVEALERAGWLEHDMYLHDWHDYSGRLIQKQKDDAARKRNTRLGLRTDVPLEAPVPRTSGGRPEDIPGTARYPTEPYPTEQNQTEEDIHEPEPQKLPTAADHVDNFTPFADYVWQNWPARKGKKLYKKKAMATLKRIPSRDWDAVAWGVDNFAESSQAIKGFAPNLHTWLTDEGWKDWLEPEQPPKGNGAPPALDPKKYTEGKYAGIFNPKAKAKGEGDAAPY